MVHIALKLCGSARIQEETAWSRGRTDQLMDSKSETTTAEITMCLCPRIKAS